MSGAAFSHVLRAGRIPPRGAHLAIEANESERQAIAQGLDIVAVDALTAELDVRFLAGGSIGVRGTLRAAVVQTDVVTLEPLAQVVEEEVDIVLEPAEEFDARRSADGENEPVADRDLYRNGQIDLGAIAVEHLALALDPYPRAPGVEFPGHLEDDAASKPSPFAALARLKRDRK